MLVSLVDCLVHLGDPRIGDPRAWLDLAGQHGVSTVIHGGVEPRRDRALPDSPAHDVAVWRAVGLHPQAIVPAELEAQLSALREFAGTPRVIALGELGLDGRRGMPAMDVQREVFAAQLGLARELELPVILHCVHATGALLEVLEGLGPLPRGGMLHAFGGPRELVTPLLRLGFSFSFGELVTRAEARRCRAAAASVPSDRLLVETDAPECGPETLSRIVATLAELRGEAREWIAELTAHNARELFGLPLPS